MSALMSKRSSAAALREIHRELDRRRKFTAVANGRIVKKSSVPPPIANEPTGPLIQKTAPTPRKHAAAAIKNPSLPTPRAPAIAYVPPGELTMRCTAPEGRDPLNPFARKVSGVDNGGIPRKSTAPPPPCQSALIRHAPAKLANEKSSATPCSASAPISRARLPQPSSANFEPIQKGTTVRVRTRMGTLPTGLRLFIWLSAVVVSDAEDGYFEVIYKGDFPRDDPFRTVRVARDQVKNMPSSHK